MTEFATTASDPAAELDVTRGFLGCLMRCTAECAGELLAGMRATDAGPGIRGTVLELILRTVAAGLPPDPRVLLAEAQRQGLLDTEHKHERFAGWLLDTLHAAPWPECGWSLRTAVLDTAFRRRLGEHAQRLADAAATAPTSALFELAELDDEVVELWHRISADHAEPQETTAQKSSIRTALEAA